MKRTLRISLPSFFSIISILSVYVCSAAAEQLPIIPGQNPSLYGMTTPAGSGRHLDPPNTNICKVTNLLDAGEGSLRYCVEEFASPKTIVFEVSGTIQLTGMMSLRGSYTTIAGQTAPSPGIIVRGGTFVVERSSSDILIQHMRFRRGDTEGNLDRPDLMDAMTLVAIYNPARDWYPPNKVVIANNSFSWSVDELTESGADNATFIRNIYGEGLSRSIHPKGEHSKGLVNTGYELGSQNVFVGENLFVLGKDRNPKSSTGKVFYANNVSYDVGEAFRTEAFDIEKSYGWTSVVGNYIEKTPKTVRSIYVISKYDVHPETRHFMGEDNFFDGAVQTDPWSKINTCGNWGAVSGCTQPLEEYKIASTPPIWPESFVPMSAMSAKELVPDVAGARPADRDAVDARLVEYVKSGATNQPYVDCVDCDNAQCTGAGAPRGCCTAAGAGTCNAAPGGWPKLATNYRALTIPVNPHETQLSGYTRLEEWLHAMAEDVEVRGELQIPAPTGLRSQ